MLKDEEFRMVRRAITLLVLVLVLLLAIIANRLTAQLRYVYAGEAGDLLYASTFDEDTLDWNEYRDGQLTAKVEGGVLLLDVQAGAGAFSLTQARFRDFDAQMQAQAIDGPVDNGFGMIFRMQNQDNQRLDDDAYYLFLISSDGYYRVMRRFQGADRILSDWINSDVIAQGIGAVNRLRVIAQGDTFQFFINDQPVQVCIPDDPQADSLYALDACVRGSLRDTLVDASIAEGQLGAIAITTPTGGAGVQVQFDHVLITMPT
jgi:hypothetical protein